MGHAGFQDRVAMRFENRQSCEIIITMPIIFCRLLRLTLRRPGHARNGVCGQLDP